MTTQVETKRLWYIHGKAYDLTPLIPWHPGGKDILLGCEGRECTELFENSHAMSNKNVHALIDRYLVKDAPAGPQPAGFTYKEDGAYAEIVRRAKGYFASTNQTHKATTSYWVGLYIFMAVYAFSMYLTFVKGYLLSAPVSGALWMMFLFYGTLHDASHQAMSKKPWVNKFWSTLTAHWGLWHHEIWLQHHVWGHHSFTGVVERDPDLVHFPEGVRKHREQKYHWVFRAQQLTFLIIFVLMPNQYVGQIIAYWSARLWRGEIFTVPVRLPKFSLYRLWPTAVESTSFLFHVVLPVYLHGWRTGLLLSALHFSFTGLLYFMIVAPNHDTDATLHVSRESLGDWGEHQIRHSSNFSHSSKLLTALFGGMNFQIEHHLFPTVCNIHYPALSRHVKQVCAERNIPYACFPSLYEALKGVARNLGNLSHP